ncbi:NAD(P)-dependent oxidoreductase [Hoeflea sp. TYP-13]|uniref:NAD(P)-dependent oxidoreductase n=1 Tax=Hoeflea sp. TYP-13 TaxID=3230023 RepID=UPI0034C66A8B
MTNDQSKRPDMHVGIIGLGKMGSAMASRLAEAEFIVSAWTRRGVSEQDAEALGIEAKPDIASLLEECDVAILSLPDDAAVITVLDQICRSRLDGRLIVDTSTVSPDTLRSRIAAIEAAGGSAIDAPISGWPQMVASGRAGIYIGGKEEDVARFMPIAAALSNRIHHVGEPGAGAAAKIVNNMMLTGYWQCLKEAMQIGKKAGLSAEKMLEILSGSPAANGSLAGKAPVILGQSDAVSFTVDGVVGDLTLFTETADRLGVDTPAIAAALASFKAHGEAGNGDADFITMVRNAYDQA